MPAPAPPKLLPWLAWLCAAAFFFYAWIQRVSPSIIVDELMLELGAGGAIVGHLSALYFYGYAGMQLPVGLLLDRFGPRRLVTAAALVCAAGGALFASASDLATLSAGRLMVGVGAAFSLVGAIHIAGQWLPAQRFAMLSGLAMMFGMAGGVFGQAPVRLAVEAFGWRQALTGIAAAGAVLAVAAWLCVRDRPGETAVSRSPLTGLRTVLRERQNWLNAIAGLGATGPLLGFGALWGVPYLQAALGVGRAEAAALASLTFVGWGLGAPFFGWLSDRLGRRREPFLGGLLLCGTTLAALIWLPLPGPLAAGAGCLVMGFGGSSQIVNFAFARAHNPPHCTATAIGLINGMVTGAGALFQPAIGLLLDLAWDGSLRDGVRHYAVDDFRPALSLLLVGLAVAFVAARGLREAPPRG